jgi:phosphoserine phosphatase RsbU/P
MPDQWNRQGPPRLEGYESWLYQMSYLDNSGDVFVTVPLSGHTEIHSEPPTRWLVAVGDVSGRGEIASRMTDILETEVIRLARTASDPATILKALNNDLFDSSRLGCLLLAVIDGDHHELTLASAGHLPPLIRRTDRRIESIAEEVSGLPLWVFPDQIYENVKVPIDPGEVVTFHSDGVTAVIDHQSNIFDLNALRQAIARAPCGAASAGQSILEAIRRFGQGRAPMDDITLLCLGRLMPEVTPKGKG